MLRRLSFQCNRRGTEVECRSLGTCATYESITVLRDTAKSLPASQEGCTELQLDLFSDLPLEDDPLPQVFAEVVSVGVPVFAQDECRRL